MNSKLLMIGLFCTLTLTACKQDINQATQNNKQIVNSKQILEDKQTKTLNEVSKETQKTVTQNNSKIDTKQILNDTKTTTIKHDILKENKELSGIIDYFSINYPYSKEQLERYFQSELVFDDRTYKKGYTFLQNNKLDLIRLRNHEKGQELILLFKKQPCFDNYEFSRDLRKKGYELSRTMVCYGKAKPITYFSKIMDERNKLGTLTITLGNQKGADCVSSLTFNTIRTKKATNSK